MVFWRLVISIECAYDGARTRGREKGKSMGKVGRGDERRYMGVGLGGSGRIRVDHQHDGGYTDAKTRKMGGGGVQKV